MLLTRFDCTSKKIFFSKKFIIENILFYSDQISDNALIDELRSEKFDLALSEYWDGCGFGIFELLQIPAHIECSATIMVESLASTMGVPNAISYVPGLCQICE